MSRQTSRVEGEARADRRTLPESLGREEVEQVEQLLQVVLQRSPREEKLVLQGVVVQDPEELGDRGQRSGVARRQRSGVARRQVRSHQETEVARRQVRDHQETEVARRQVRGHQETEVRGH